MGLRKSARLRTLNSKSISCEIEESTDNKSIGKRRKTSSKSGGRKDKGTVSYANKTATLPRKLEKKFNAHVIGIDEAGRGPLAGPVVAAAVIYPRDQACIDGIIDSKKITKAEEREKLYEAIVATANIRWAVCVIDARRIDEINVLQATLEAMRNAVLALIKPLDLTVRQVAEASVSEHGCYVVAPDLLQHKETNQPSSNKSVYFALIDGNKAPKDMPCNAECVVKGDGKEYVIASASILAKVTRDRLMHGYNKIYPAFGLARHKGYPTAAHVAAINEHGISPIHRRSFAPIKTMDLTNN